MAHTNHFIGDRAFSVKDNLVLVDPSSISRYSKALQLMTTINGHSIESFKTVLADHYDYPTSICFHSAGKYEPDHEEDTISSVIMVPEERILMATNGPPCTNRYHTVSF